MIRITNVFNVGAHGVVTHSNGLRLWVAFGVTLVTAVTQARTHIPLLTKSMQLSTRRQSLSPRVTGDVLYAPTLSGARAVVNEE
jgi:hypothetical protein